MGESHEPTEIVLVFAIIALIVGATKEGWYSMYVS
jgi:Sec-independent protein translocase protein TatA